MPASLVWAGSCRGGLTFDRRIPEKVEGEVEEFTVTQVGGVRAGIQSTLSTTHHASVIFPWCQVACGWKHTVALTGGHRLDNLYPLGCCHCLF